jgi:hypothetical protein
VALAHKAEERYEGDYLLFFSKVNPIRFKSIAEKIKPTSGSTNQRFLWVLFQI